MKTTVNCEGQWKKSCAVSKYVLEELRKVTRNFSQNSWYLNWILTKFESDTFHVKWVPCHHGMVHPRVADGGGGLHIWRVAANVLNKQSQTADSG
jgi:hypothetical protein